MTDIERVKKEVREDQVPFFEENDFEYYLEKNNGDVNATIYEMLILKSEDPTISISTNITTSRVKLISFINKNC